jgi:hypothetical protein
VWQRRGQIATTTQDQNCPTKTSKAGELIKNTRQVRKGAQDELKNFIQENQQENNNERLPTILIGYAQEIIKNSTNQSAAERVGIFRGTRIKDTDLVCTEDSRSFGRLESVRKKTRARWLHLRWRTILGQHVRIPRSS